MKKCKKCGALQSDDKTTCLDCGTLLGRPMTESEEAAAEEALDDQLDNMAERMQDFYVPLRDKIMGVLSILCIVAAFVLITLMGMEKGSIEKNIPDNVMVSVGNGAIVIMSDGTSDYQYPSGRMRELDNAAWAGVFCIIAHLFAFPMLLFPRFMWLLDTWKYRFFHNWDTTPSEFALVSRKVVTYLMFTAGVIALLCGYYLYL